MSDRNLLDELVADSVVGDIKPLFKKFGLYITTSGEIQSAATIGVEWDTPWIHSSPDPNRHCRVLHALWDCLKFIPDRCLHCWKVVLRPKTVHQLFHVLRMQETMGVPCKCGAESRPYVFGNYGAYWYTDSVAEGKERHREVANLVRRNRVLRPLLDSLDDQGRYTNLVLKRYCTEFELRHGRSDRYIQTVVHRRKEKAVMASLAIAQENMTQPKVVIDHVKQKWLEFAYDRGDPTAMHYNNNKPFYTPSVFYHEAKEEDDGNKVSAIHM